jgi:hypothetical protein
MSYPENIDPNILSQTSALPHNTRSKGARGKVHGTQNYTAQDVDTLLNVVNDILPIGSYEWEQVHERYADSIS